MKIVFLLIAITFSNLLLLSQPSFLTGKGTEDEPYEIWSKEHWNELSDSSYAYSHPSNYLNDNYNPMWARDKHFYLMNDIHDVSQPIYGYTIGYFNGKNKIITESTDEPSFGCPGGIIDSLIINGNANSQSGKFSIGDAHIINNCINNITILCYPCEYEWIYGIGYHFVGSITVYNHGTISHCINNGSVSGVDFVAGIAADNQLGIITNCINTGKITASNTEENVYDWWTGQGASGITIRYNASNCVNLGVIEGMDYVAGIVSYTASGDIPLLISNCINTGFIKGRRYVGGIAGMNVKNSSSITNCVNTGVVEGEEDVGNIVGGER